MRLHFTYCLQEKEHTRPRFRLQPPPPELAATHSLLMPHLSLGALGTAAGHVLGNVGDRAGHFMQSLPPAAGHVLGNVGDRAGQFMHSLHLMGSRVSCMKALPCPCSGKTCQQSWDEGHSC